MYFHNFRSRCYNNFQRCYKLILDNTPPCRLHLTSQHHFAILINVTTIYRRKYQFLIVTLREDYFDDKS